VADSHVAQRHRWPDAGADGLAEGLLGRKALRQQPLRRCHPGQFALLRRRQDAPHHFVAIAPMQALHARHGEEARGPRRFKLDEDVDVAVRAEVGTQGRAEDVLIAATYKLSDNLGVRAGYRILEGGADNDEVYNFALFHFASVGISYTFLNKKQAN